MREGAPLVAWSAVHGLSGILSLPSPQGQLDHSWAVDIVVSSVRRAIERDPTHR